MHKQQIFISHSSMNKEFADKLYESLLSEGYWVWMDKDLKEAEKWKPQIEDNLRKSNKFIVLISSYSVNSKWVRHEGSMAYALEQFIIPISIEGFGKYSPADLPIWVEETQLFNWVGEDIDYQDRFKRLKQRLGDPFPIQKHVEEMLILYQTSEMLLDEVALSLIEKHYDDIVWPKGKKALADELIEKSRRKLLDYWERYDKLGKAYEKAITDNYKLNKVLRIRFVSIVVLCITLALYALLVIYSYTH